MHAGVVSRNLQRDRVSSMVRISDFSPSSAREIDSFDTWRCERKSTRFESQRVSSRRRRGKWSLESNYGNGLSPDYQPSKVSQRKRWSILGARLEALTPEMEQLFNVPSRKILKSNPPMHASMCATRLSSSTLGVLWKPRKERRGQVIVIFHGRLITNCVWNVALVESHL